MPWYNDTIHMVRRNRRQAERKRRKTRSVDDRELYLAAKRNVCDLTISAKQAYFKDKLTCDRAIVKMFTELLVLF